MYQYSKSKFKILKYVVVIFIIESQIVACSNATSEKDNIASANNSLKEVFKIGYPKGYLVARMLANKDYPALEKYFRNLEGKYKDNVLFETKLLRSYEIFDSSLSQLLPQLNEWVETRGTYIAYCARGFYYEQAGYQARGGEYIQNTPKSKILEMEKYHVQAVKDFKKSIEINPDNIFAYDGLISVAMAEDDDSAKDNAYSEAIKHDKRTYYARFMYLRSLTPRWGGSYAQMQKVIDQSLPYAKLNPRIWSLRGMVDYDKAYDFYLNDKYKLAITYMGQALKYGDRTDWLNRRAECYGRTGQFQLELKDREKILFYKPFDTGTRNQVTRLKEYLAKKDS